MSKDRRDGDELEALWLSLRYPDRLAEHCPDGKWDWWIAVEDDKSITCECKRDRKAHGTGNFFLEMSLDGQPSGWSVSQADVWAVSKDDLAGNISMILELTAEAMRRCLFRAPHQKLVSGGDELKARGRLVLWKHLELEDHWRWKRPAP